MRSLCASRWECLISCPERVVGTEDEPKFEYLHRIVVLLPPEWTDLLRR